MQTKEKLRIKQENKKNAEKKRKEELSERKRIERVPGVSRSEKKV